MTNTGWHQAGWGIPCNSSGPIHWWREDNHLACDPTSSTCFGGTKISDEDIPVSKVCVECLQIVDASRKIIGPSGVTFQRNPRQEWSYTLSEAELGMFAFCSYMRENTDRPHNAPESLRFIGRVPEALIKAVHGLSDWGSGRGALSSPYRYDGRFDGIHFFTEDKSSKWSIAITLSNGEEIVRIAKEYYQ